MLLPLPGRQGYVSRHRAFSPWIGSLSEWIQRTEDWRGRVRGLPQGVSGEREKRNALFARHLPLVHVEFAGLSSGITVFYIDRPARTEIQLVVDTGPNGRDGAASASHLRRACEVHTTPAIKALSTHIIASAIPALLIGAIRCAVGKCPAFVDSIEGIPDTPPGFILFCAIGELKPSIKTLDHRVFVHTGTFETHISAWVPNAFTRICIAEFHAFAGAAHAATLVRSAFFVFALGFAVGLITKPIATAGETGITVSTGAPASIRSAYLTNTWGHGIADGNARAFIVTGVSVLAETTDAAAPIRSTFLVFTIG